MKPLILLLLLFLLLPDISNAQVNDSTLTEIVNDIHEAGRYLQAGSVFKIAGMGLIIGGTALLIEGTFQPAGAFGIILGTAFQFIGEVMRSRAGGLLRKVKLPVSSN